MNKMNKKGFTLIEMLVVIAIIAVLVAIIIPTVTSSTTKAQAATNAANLRSVKAEIVTTMLGGGGTTGSGLTVDKDGNVTVTALSTKFNDLTNDPLPSGYTAKGSFDATAGFACSKDTNGNIFVTYDGLYIDDWAAIAG